MLGKKFHVSGLAILILLLECDSPAQPKIVARISTGSKWCDFFLQKSSTCYDW